MAPNEELLILTLQFEPPKRGQLLFKGHDVWSQLRCPLYGATVYSTFHLLYFLIGTLWNRLVMSSIHLLPS